MRIWLLTVGEPLNSDGPSARLLRSVQFANWLAQDPSNEVVFWTGTMDHYGRRLRSLDTTVTKAGENYTVVQLKGRLYKRSISVNRFLNHVDVAKEFRRISEDFESPDVVLSSYPTEELCRAVLDYAEQRSIPVVIDVRDLWPDIFADALPKALRGLAPIVFHRFKRKAQATLARANALCGPAESMVDWGAKLAGRKRNQNDFWFPFTYDALPSKAPVSDQSKAQTVKQLCFFGAVTTRVNLEMVIDAFAILEKRNVPVRLKICGTGDALEALTARARGLESVEFAGWIDKTQLAEVMRQSIGGIFPYNTPDYFNNLPNKVCEYLAGGLPIFACTQGEVKRLIEGEGCGFWSEPDSGKFANMVENALNNTNALALAAEAASDVFKKHFDQESVFTNTKIILQGLAASGKNSIRREISR